MIAGRVAIILVTLSTGLACQDTSRIAALEARLKTLEDAGEKNAAALRELKLDLNLHESLTSDPYKTAIFDPADPGGYSRLDSDGGTFLVSLVNADRYLDGYRVTMHFGNPSSATYAGFKLKAKWGARYEKGGDYSAWSAALREKSLDLTTDLDAGSWNKVSFVLSPAKPEEFGHLELSITTNTVRLRHE